MIRSLQTTAPLRETGATPTPAASDRAIAHVRECAQAVRAEARDRAIVILQNAGEPAGAFDLLATAIRAHARVTLNFHPDRYVAEGHTVAEGLLREGRYLCQSDTRISNGSRTAFPGGERDSWEHELFGAAYHGPDASSSERPKYGALDVMEHADGGSPRFGSCYFVLRPHLTARATLTWGDSHVGPEHVGTIDVPESILAAMLDAAVTHGYVLGVRGMSVGELLRRLHGRNAAGHRDPSTAPAGRALDEYIEAQIHGPIDLATDVERLVADPAFLGTPTGDVLAALCEQHGIPFRQHQGFVLRPDEVPADFRGPRMVPLAQRVAGPGGTLDAVSLGRAAASLHCDPGSWEDWGSYDETLQHLKELWHVLVGAGRPR